MSDRSGFEPPEDEPIIGGSYPPPASYPPAEEPVIGGGQYPPVRYADPEPRIGDRPVATPDRRGYQPAPAYQDPYDDPQYEDDYDEEDYYDEEESVARQPLFWVALGLGAVVIVGFVFVLFALFSGGDGGGDTAFNVRIDSPSDGDRLEIGREFEVIVQASSSEAITRFELFIDDQVADQQELTDANPSDVQRVILHHTFDDRGDYEMFVRITASDGSTEDSDVITVIAVEAVDETPATVTGRVIAVVSARTGPGDEFDVVGSLQPGDEVVVRGKTRNTEWLLVDASVGDDIWVRRAAIELDDALALVPVREPTPTPQPTTTEEPSETPTGTSTPDGSLPDFIPAGAILVDGGDTVRVTIANNGGSDYAGPLVVSISQLESVTQVFNVDIAQNGTDTVDLPLTTTVTEQSTVRVTVDSDDAIEEGQEDNNSATFTVNPPVDAPEIIIANYNVGGGNLTSTIQNTGGPLASSTVTVRVSVTVDGQTTSAETSKTIALANGQTSDFVVNISGLPSGQPGILAVFVDGQQVASTNVAIP